MWRLLYLFLLFIRVYFAVSPSYLHPDEIFQGPEPVAGYLFPYPTRPTWEWTSSRPIRSVFPLWPIYGLPMTLLKWTWAQEEDGDCVDTTVIYYTLRLVMFLLSFVLEDWAVHELVRSPRRWIQAVILVTSSYVTWTFQTHTFSNSVETLLVLWSLVMIERILRDKTSNLAQHGLHPHYQHLLINLPQLLGPALILLIASAYPFNLRILKGILSNNRLASAGAGCLLLSLVPHQEPRFLLPAVPLILTSIRAPSSKIRAVLFWTTWVIFNGVLAILMGVYHQGGIIPAQLAMPSLVTHSLNTTHSDAHNVEIFWWKTYPPPTFLLGSDPLHPTTNRSLNISTVPLMGYPQKELVFMLMQHMPTCDPTLVERLILHKEKTDVFVVAPLSAWRLDASNPLLISSNHPPVQKAEFTYPPVSNFSFAIDMNIPPAQLTLTNLAVFRRHLNLDDLDFGDDGVWPTLERVVGRRGLGVWRVDRICGPVEYVDAHTGEKLTTEQVNVRKAANNEGREDLIQEADSSEEASRISSSAVIPTIAAPEEYDGRRASTTTVPPHSTTDDPGLDL
ncbi:hypothetical protein AYO20_08617 [Fonsecaea nubica]|uniref:Mannosyltransferase n=1 Tax=Fonsecaea nubica TaxID=856822 RepID=A0A178CNZ9_9EURO|nr:hypothetical protein AYO20_08617 [Fonsecaea nubica]OAL30655.1 hypothetical protein AYO20_08617 [Fonsecaea nubica]